MESTKKTNKNLRNRVLSGEHAQVTAPPTVRNTRIFVEIWLHILIYTHLTWTKKIQPSPCLRPLVGTAGSCSFNSAPSKLYNVQSHSRHHITSRGLFGGWSSAVLCSIIEMKQVLSRGFFPNSSFSAHLKWTITRSIIMSDFLQPHGSALGSLIHWELTSDVTADHSCY